MMKHRILTLLVVMPIIMISVNINALAQTPIIDTSSPEKLVTLGFRAGLTSSNVSPNYSDVFADVTNANGDWGYGFSLGFVADLNIKEFFSIQPGIFFANKSYNTLITNIDGVTGALSMIDKHSRFYYFQIPVLASFKFNLSDNFKLIGEFGPYFAFGAGGNTKVKELKNVASADGVHSQYEHYDYSYFGDSTMKYVQMRKGDWGFKFGAGLKFANRFSLNVHYLAGCSNVARHHKGYEDVAVAHNKEWTFTLGVDF